MKQLSNLMIAPLFLLALILCPLQSIASIYIYAPSHHKIHRERRHVHDLNYRIDRQRRRARRDFQEGDIAGYIQHQHHAEIMREHKRAIKRDIRRQKKRRRGY